MLYTLAIVLVVAWLLGAMGIYTVGPLLHLLLVIALVLAVVGFLNGRRALG
ncbi:MAG: lmo0937 family membrane protein [Bacteroidales bacterium]